MQNIGRLKREPYQDLAKHCTTNDANVGQVFTDYQPRVS